MPPKKASKNLLVLKLKRQSSTYVVESNANGTLDDLKVKLTTMINSTNGLKKDDTPISLDVQDSMNLSAGVDHVPVPKIGLNDSSDSETEKAIAENSEDEAIDIEEKSTATELNDNSHIQVSADQIIIGKFENGADIYASAIEEFDEADDSKLDKLDLEDFASLAFKLKDEEFKIYKPQYD